MDSWILEQQRNDILFTISGLEYFRIFTYNEQIPHDIFNIISYNIMQLLAPELIANYKKYIRDHIMRLANLHNYDIKNKYIQSETREIIKKAFNFKKFDIKFNTGKFDVLNFGEEFPNKYSMNAYFTSFVADFVADLCPKILPNSTESIIHFEKFAE